MPLISVYPQSDVDGDDLAILLVAAGCQMENGISGFLECANSAENLESEVVVLVLTNGLRADVNAERKIINRVSENKRIIGIWPKNIVEAESPDWFKKYSDDQVVWNASKVHKAICMQDDPIYDDADGQPKTTTTTERHSC